MTQTIKLISPVDGSVYAEREVLSPESARAAVARASAAQPEWAALPLDTRIAKVMAGVEALIAMNDHIVPELARMMGRPVRYGGEMGGVRERADYMARIAPDVLAPEVVEDSDRFRRELHRAPVGVVFIIAPWNYPFLTAINGIVPALIAGNAAVLKHASQTLLAGERLAEAMQAGGVPAEVFQNLVLDHATTEALISERLFGFVNFTGSVAGGLSLIHI